ncbi:MAG: flagellar basal body-associated FliL family protein [Deltaproteobacteria bacterium]|nr:flagellar basal body-associated FliL family protein [Deltaproteobacteria bacterium]
MANEKADIMIDEMGDGTPEKKTAPKKGLGMKMMILVGGVVLLLGGGGYVGYSMLSHEKDKAPKTAHEEKKGPEKMALVSMEPFILNLADPGRHLKVSIQFELKDEKDDAKVKERTPKLRDLIIMLLSSKTVDSVSSAEGKFQLKDEILLRANQAMEKELFKNVYFTDFVMQ